MAEEVPFRQITVVDFSAFSIAHQEVPGATDPTVKQMVKDLYAGCNTFGFVYLTNHGIPQEEIDNVLQTMDKFFTLESCLKEKYKKQVKRGWSGWIKLGSETLDEKTEADLKEAFDISAKGDEEFVFPGDDLVPGFKFTVLGFRNRLSKLTDRVLTALAIGLDVIATEDGTFIPVTPIPGTVIVNIADLMQRWSSDRYKSVVHRVIIPKEQSKKAKSRQSTAYFVNPREDTLITCLDGSDKYPPIKAGQYIANLVENQYKY